MKLPKTWRLAKKKQSQTSNRMGKKKKTSRPLIPFLNLTLGPLYAVLRFAEDVWKSKTYKTYKTYSLKWVVWWVFTMIKRYKKLTFNKSKILNLAFAAENVESRSSIKGVTNGSPIFNMALSYMVFPDVINLYFIMGVMGPYSFGRVLSSFVPLHHHRKQLFQKGSGKESHPIHTRSNWWFQP